MRHLRQIFLQKQFLKAFCQTSERVVLGGHFFFLLSFFYFLFFLGKMFSEKVKTRYYFSKISYGMFQHTLPKWLKLSLFIIWLDTKSHLKYLHRVQMFPVHCLNLCCFQATHSQAWAGHAPKHQKRVDVNHCGNAIYHHPQYQGLWWAATRELEPHCFSAVESHIVTSDCCVTGSLNRWAHALV